MFLEKRFTGAVPGLRHGLGGWINLSLLRLPETKGRTLEQIEKELLCSRIHREPPPDPPD